MVLNDTMQDSTEWTSSLPPTTLLLNSHQSMQWILDDMCDTIAQITWIKKYVKPWSCATTPNKSHFLYTFSHLLRCFSNQKQQQITLVHWFYDDDEVLRSIFLMIPIFVQEINSSKIHHPKHIQIMLRFFKLNINNRYDIEILSAHTQQRDSCFFSIF